MPPTRRLIVVALVALLVAASGCSGLQDATGQTTEATETTPTTSQVDRITQQARLAADDIETYRYDLVMEMDPQDSNETVTLDTSGAVNRSARRLRSETTVASAAMPGDGISITQYLVGETQYVRSTGRFSTDWRAQNVSDRDIWNRSQQLGKQQAVLRAANVTLAGNATIDGTDVYVLAVDISEDRLMEVLRQRRGQSMAGDVELTDVSYTMYVTQDTTRLKRVEANMTMTSNDRTWETDLQLTLRDYDDSVDIDLPPEAEDAEPMTAA